MNVDKMAAEMADREAIRDVMMRYARAIDRIDMALLRSVYWEEAADNHGNYDGGVDGFVAWVEGGLVEMDQTMHMLGNIHIEIHGGAAAVESYFQAYHRMKRPDGQRFDAVIAGRYVDLMVRRGREWRILRRELAYDWYREYPDSGDWASNIFGVPIRSNRAPGDISYEIIREARERGVA